MSEYEQGYKDGSKDASAYKMGLYRIAAFGAIRRAAEVARSWDTCVTDSCLCHTNAEQIRIAIRAAIGSPKA